ncbi:thioredoxin family protein [Parapedobacter sp. ISTM3]|uniref:thioredoxin domain-containing protein n=1 Tax=Parapedobacter sp. ISTM3 TaxID=2800130 RepID=UPI001903655B|nr:thioredoxin domain-containing protein [Parapedobacter sp. ISTM3]MBK1439893.1 thioredoxin family protein [Parapedobacter sp. ISTM3]
MRYIAVLFFSIVVNGFASGQVLTDTISLSAEGFADKIASTEHGIIVDVRTPGEFKKGHLQNALNLDWTGSEFREQLATLDKSQPVFVYCLSGGRSTAAAEVMRETGFRHVYEMQGGMMKWRAAGLREVSLANQGAGMTLTEYEALLNSNKPVLVDFYADWCAPCKKMEPYMDRIIADMDGKVRVLRINADENAALCKELGISGLPVLKLYKDGEIVWDHSGFAEEDAIREKLK